MRLETLRNVVGAGALSVAVVIGAREIIDDKLSDNNQDYSSESTELLDYINPESTELVDYITDFRKSLDSMSPDEAQLLKSSYLYVNGNLQVLYSQQVSVEGDGVGSILAPEVEDQFYEEARKNIIIGALLSEHLYPGKIKVDDDFKHVMLEDQTQLDLGDPLELSLASAFIENTLSNQENSQYSFYDLPTPEELKQEAEDLKWLVSADVNVDIDSGSFVIVPKDYLVKMSKILQELEINNMPFPNQIKFKTHEPGDPAGGYYDSKSSRPFTIMITNFSDANVVIHENGHFVSDAVNLNDGNANLASHSQGAFEQMIGAIQTRYGIEDSITEEEDLVEEYANKFTLYFLRGDSFRYMVVNTSSEVEKEALVQEYNFFKELFGGREFRTDGVLVEHLGSEEINPNTVIEITDTDTERPGIFLRPYPTLDIDVSYPVVWDEDDVRILEGPVFLIGPDGNDVEMWKVRRGLASHDTFYEARDDNGELIEGWISREWFGRIISD